MTYFVYLIGNYRKTKLITYVGYTNNLEKRVNSHNSGTGAKFTRGKNWKLIYHEKYQTRREAMLRENYLKNNRELRNFIKNKYK